MTDRILHINPGNLFGGIETYLVTLAKYRNVVPGVEHQFAVCFPGRFHDEIASTNASLHKLPAVRVSRPWTVWKARRRLSDLITQIIPKSIVIHGLWSLAVFGSVASRRNLPLVFVAHNDYRGATVLERLAVRRRPQLVISNSRFTQRSIAPVFPHSHHEVCRYPVEGSLPGLNDGRSVIRRALGTPEDRVVVIQVSRMESWKGQHLLIEALKNLSGDPTWEAWIVGGPQRDQEVAYLRQLQDLTSRYGLSNRVRFLGQRTDARQLLAAADIFCQPNDSPEPFGIVFIEALYAGLPVVTFDFGGAAEIVTHECGILSPPRNTEALAKALARLITDPQFRSRLSRHANARAKELCDPELRVSDFARLITNN